MVLQHESLTADQEIIGLVKEMAKAQTVEQISRVWASDITWFDVANCMVRGLDGALSEYGEQFELITNLRTEIIDIRSHVDGTAAFAYSVQHFLADGRNGGADVNIVFRQTDCFVKRDGRWELIHQHVSLPMDPATGSVVTDSRV